MRFALLLCAGAIAMFAADAGAADKEVAAAMEALRSAMLKGDAAGMDKLLHPDLTYSHSSAKNETKAECIESATKPGNVAKDIVFHDGTTRIYGNTALYKGKGDFTTAAGVVNHLDVLMVWLKTSKGWLLVARQSTKLP